MAVKVHQVIPDDCTSIAGGTLLRLFDAKCTYNLHTFPTTPASVNPYKNKVPRSNNKNAIVSLEANKQIQLCDLPNFAKRNFVIRGKVKKFRLCPFDRGLRYRIGYSYSEATNPSNGVSTPALFAEFDWPTTGNSVTHTITTPSFGDPFSRGSTGDSNFTITMTLTAPETNNSCESVGILIQATLNSMGKAVTYYVGTPVVQNRNAGCVSMQNGQAVAGFWTGVNSDAGPIGLVMSTSWSVQGVLT